MFKQYILHVLTVRRVNTISQNCHQIQIWAILQYKTEKKEKEQYSPILRVVVCNPVHWHQRLTRTNTDTQLQLNSTHVTADPRKLFFDAAIGWEDLFFFFCLLFLSSHNEVHWHQNKQTKILWCFSQVEATQRCPTHGLMQLLAGRDAVDFDSTTSTDDESVSFVTHVVSTHSSRVQIENMFSHCTIHMFLGWKKQQHTQTTQGNTSLTYKLKVRAERRLGSSVRSES